MVEVAYALPEEREEIARFMQEVFPRAKWPLDGWRALLARRWPHPEDIYAITARDGGRLVGVLGLVTAERATAAGPKRTANMTSWYVQKPYRGAGTGHQMIALATADPAVTVTNFTSSRGAVRVVESAGMRVLDQERLLWHPRAMPLARLPVHTDIATLGTSLNEYARRVLTDHAGLNLARAVVETPDGLCPLLYTVKRKQDAYLTYEVLYAGDHSLLARHTRAIADTLLPQEGAMLSIDRRFLPADMEADAIDPIPVARYYIPGNMAAAEVDYLYSEIVMLDMKMS